MFSSIGRDLYPDDIAVDDGHDSRYWPFSMALRWLLCVLRVEWGDQQAWRGSGAVMEAISLRRIWDP